MTVRVRADDEDCVALPSQPMAGIYRTEPSPDVLAWFRRYGFEPSDLDCWEKVYSGSIGYGRITVRFMPNDYGYDAIVETGHGDQRHGLNLGLCQTIAHMHAIAEALFQFDYANYQPLKVPAVPLHA
jgi:hypothetical protein